MINFIIVAVGLYLIFGLILTGYGLTNEDVMKSLRHCGFISTVFIMLTFVISAPIFFARFAYKHFKAGGQSNVKKSRDEEK